MMKPGSINSSPSICNMKRWLSFLAGLSLLLSCNPEQNNINGGEPENGSPALVITGLPSEKVNPYSTFILTATSPSDGYIGFQSSSKSIASVYLNGRRQYKVVIGLPQEDTPVTITFTQEEDGDYPELSAEVTFTVLSEDSAGNTVDIVPHEDLPGVKVSFTEATSPVTNPERGFYRQASDFFSKSSPLSLSEVKAARLQGFTLWYLGFYLTDFMDAGNSTISQSYLDKFQSSMDALREGGAKCVLRFAYKNDSGNHPVDPEVDVVLNHIEQLTPYIRQNADVIFVMQAGFVGPWGEWHSSDHFTGDSGRKKVADALLKALPETRQIQLRTPKFKMTMYKLKVADTLTVATAHDGSVKSRIGGHNDCFGKSENDSGTFDNITDDREFWKGDTRYTIMGGETCGTSEYCTCPRSQQDMVDYHWTYLNNDYNTSVLNVWRKGNCFDNIVNRLGYRLVMQDLFYSEGFAAGKRCDVTLRFYNTGYAAPMNPREAKLVWISSSGNRQAFQLNSDPRTWHTGYHVVKAQFTPSSAKGTLYLQLSDPMLPTRPEYSIALANEGVFDAQTGLNKLFEVK